MSGWLSIAWLVAATSVEPEPDAEPDDDAPPTATDEETFDAPVPPEDALVSPADAQAQALAELARSHDLRAAGDAAGAVEAATTAVARDPGLAAAWLARAQARIDLAGDEPTSGDPSGVTWAATLRAAADDLEHYLGLAAVQGPARSALEAERDRLRRRATEWTPREHQGPVEPAPAPPPVEVAVAPVDTPVSRDDTLAVRSRRGAALLSVGVLGTMLGTGLFTASVRVRQTCAGLCAASWETRDSILAPAAIGVAMGAALVPWGTARLVALKRPSVRMRRVLGGSLLGAAGAALATGIGLLVVANARWNGALPSDDAELGRIQQMTNAGIAVSSVVPAAAGAGLAALLSGRRRVQQRRMSRTSTPMRM